MSLPVKEVLAVNAVEWVMGQKITYASHSKAGCGYKRLNFLAGRNVWQVETSQYQTTFPSVDRAVEEYNKIKLTSEGGGV